MKIQIKQLRQNLSKIQLNRAKISQHETFKSAVRFINGIFLIFFIIQKYDCQLSIMTSLSKMISTQLKRYLSPFVALSLLLIVLSSTSLIFLILLRKKNQDSTQKSLIKFQQRIIEKTLPYILFISEILTIPILVIINNINNVGDYSQIKITIICLICSVLSQVTIDIFKLEIPYSIKLNIIIISPQLLPSLIAKALAIVITYYELNYKKKYQLTYSLILTILFLSLFEMYYSGSVQSYHLVSIISSVGLVQIMGAKSQYFGKTIQQENDYLFKKIEKLNKDQKLSYQQKINTMTIIQITKIRYDNLQDDFLDYIIINSCLPKSHQIFPQELNKEKILQFTKFKIDLDHAINQNNLQLKLQRYELKIIEKTLATRQLYEIQKLYIQIKKSSNYQEIVRLQRFIKKIEEYFLKEDSNINCQLILDIDKRVEEFYNQVGKTIEYYSNLWINLFQNQIDQKQLSKLLKLLIKAQGNAYKILRKLSNLKDIEFESTIANFLHNLINANTDSLFQPRKRTQQTKIKQTQYLIGTKNAILNSSLVVARRIIGKQQLIIGRKLTQILYDFEIDYFQEHLNKSESNNEHPITSLVAFKVCNSKLKFITFQSQLRVIPDPIHGIRFFFHFNGDNEYEKNLFIYCLQNDQIIGFSESIFKKFKIDEYFLSSDLFGVHLFNIIINNFINKQSIQSTLPIKCQINLNNLSNRKKTQTKKDPIDAELVINQAYKANELNYIIFELKIHQQEIQKTNKQFIQEYINKNKDFNIPNHTFSDNQLTFCRINNPLAVIIDEKLAKISNNNGITYLKISVILIIITIFIAIGMFLFVKIQSQTANKSLKKQMSVVSSTNILIQQLYQLFYQYYQYYQVENYPQQITAIQYYNMKAINNQYFTKTHKNINTIVQKLIYNKNPQKIQDITFKFNSYEADETTYKPNFINFLDKIKQALATNNPQFLIRNYQLVYAFISSFIPYSTNSIYNIKKSIQFTTIISIVLLAILLVVQKHLLIRIHRFRQTILKLYAILSLKDCKKSMQRAQQLMNMLQKNHLYWRQKNKLMGQSQFNLKIQSEKLLKNEFQKDGQPISKQIMSKKLKKSYVQAIFSKNLLLITPIFLIGFYLIFNHKLQQFTYESNNIVRYSSAIQNSSVLLIERGTVFLQNAMEGQIFAPNQFNSTNLSTFTLSTQIKIDLPQSFNDFKIAEREMLNFDLCEYAYLNTGSLYRNIQCSDILDGVMNMGFTETYVFLLQKIQRYKGVSMRNLGKLYRPYARYPFWMEVFYTRRTINNMLAFIQKQFVITVQKYLSQKQDELQSFVTLGFCMVPLLMIAAWVFIKEIRSQCERSIKCLRILPRSFIMRIEISKQLHKSGTLQEIQLIAP